MRTAPQINKTRSCFYSKADYVLCLVGRISF